MKSGVTFFLPVRKGSQRVKDKNTRIFCGIEGGLIALKLQQLMSCKKLDRVILSTNDEKSIEIAQKIDPRQNKIKVIERPEYLCLDSTPLKDLILYIPSIINSAHILWGHTTTPFVDAHEYDKIVDTYLLKINEGYDSVITTAKFQNFMLNQDGSILNYKHGGGQWPRTQDLPIWHEVNHAVFLTSRKTYVDNSDRIGNKPYLYVQDKIKSFDIDWEDDFLIAEAIYSTYLINQ